MRTLDAVWRAFTLVTLEYSYIVDTTKHSDVRARAVEVLDSLLKEYTHLYDEVIVAGMSRADHAPSNHAAPDPSALLHVLVSDRPCHSAPWPFDPH